MNLPTKLTSPTQVRQLLEERGIAPSKALGQNFLIDANIRDGVLEAAQVSPGDTVLEIGPGLGVLTEALLRQGIHVLAVEKDARLSQWLSDYFADDLAAGRLTLMQADALEVDLAGLVENGARRVISNLPYSVGNRILVDLALGRCPPDTITIMVQEDVAGRILAPPHCGEYGLLTVFCGLRYDAEVVRRVSSACFVPVPRVGSTILHLTRNPRLDEALEDLDGFVRLVKQCFEHRRKQVQSILARWTGLPATMLREGLSGAGLEPAARPEDLSVEQWIRLANLLPRIGFPLSRT